MALPIRLSEAGLLRAQHHGSFEPGNVNKRRRGALAKPRTASLQKAPAVSHQPTRPLACTECHGDRHHGARAPGAPDLDEPCPDCRPIVWLRAS